MSDDFFFKWDMSDETMKKAEIRTTLKQLHDLYVDMQNAGFTKEEAFGLIIAIIQNSKGES